MIGSGFRTFQDRKALDNLHLFKKFVFKEHAVPLPKCLVDLEVPREEYFRDYLTIRERLGVASLQDKLSDFLSQEGIEVSLLAIGSSTFPRKFMIRSITHSDIDLLVVAKNLQDLTTQDVYGGYGRKPSRMAGIKYISCQLAETIDRYLITNGIRDLSSLAPVPGQVYVPYGKLNTYLPLDGDKRIHLVLEYYHPSYFKVKEGATEEEGLLVTEPIAERKIAEERKRNLPFCLLKE
ncbi:hypothetical protein J4417_02170 [Candidatus Woesearchaeota archaeon]|nr:hypothetical protein [Candidatus Woesearchaeota archaeon]